MAFCDSASGVLAALPSLALPGESVGEERVQLPALTPELPAGDSWPY